jgi:hypothetical protein
MILARSLTEVGRSATRAADRRCVITRQFAPPFQARHPLLLALHHMTGYITGHTWERTMSDTAQKRALRNYRSRLAKRGIARFEVLGLNADRDLIRSVARRLAEDGPDSARIRAAIGRTISGDPPKRGGILEALRRSPLAGADLEFSRSRETGRKVDL